MIVVWIYFCVYVDTYECKYFIFVKICFLKYVH